MKAKPDVWMPLFPGDYLADTSRLTLEQHGAYLLLIMDYWRNGPPPDDPEVLARILGITPASWAKIAPAILAMFRPEGGQLRHKRIDAERSGAAARQEKAHAKAVRAASARWPKHDKSGSTSNAPSMPQGLPEDVHELCPPHSPPPNTLKPEAERPRTKLPRGMLLTEPQAASAKQLKPNWDETRTLTVFQNFRDHHVSRGTVCEDWDAAWMLWVRNEKDGAPPSAGRHPTLAEKRAANMKQLIEGGTQHVRAAIEGSRVVEDPEAIQAPAGDLRIENIGGVR